MFNGHKSKRDWLRCHSGKIGCVACGKVKEFSVSQKQGSGANISREWAQCLVAPNGASRKSQLTSLRKKMHDHENSAAHKTAVEVYSSGSRSHTKFGGNLKRAAEEMTSSLVSKTCHVLRSTYKVAKCNNSFLDF